MKTFVCLRALVGLRWLGCVAVVVVAGEMGAGCAAPRLSAVVRSTSYTTQQGYGEVTEVDCQAGEVATGGGYLLASGIPIGRIPTAIVSRPVWSGTTPGGWQVRWYWSPTGERWEVYVICATLQ